MRFTAAAGILAAIFFALRPAIGRAQSNSPANAAFTTSETRAVQARSGPSGVVALEENGSVSVPAIASNIPVRALAANAFAASGAAENGPRSSSLFLTSAAEPNRLLNLLAARLSPIAGAGPLGSLGDGGDAAAAQFDLKLDSLVERSGIAVAADGTIFIADTRNSTIRRIAGAASSEPGIIRSIAGRFASAQNVRLSEPLGLAVDRAGDLFIADRAANAVLVLHSATEARPGNLELLAQMISPASIAVTQDGGEIFAASPESGGIFEIDARTKSIRQLQNAITQKPATQSAASGERADRILPAGLAADALGNLFVADANHAAILRLDSASGKISAIATGLRAPGDLAFDAKGNLYAADQGRNQVVVVADPSGAACAASPGNTVTICPGAGAFGNEPSGGATSPQAFTLTNNSMSAIAGLAIAIDGANAGDFTKQSATCVSSLAAGASCTVNIVFAPTATGQRSASLDVSDSNPQDSVSAALSGTGDDFEIQPASGQSQSVTVKQGNTATYNLEIVPDGVFSGEVTIVCPTNLPVDANGQVSVLCKSPSSPVSVTPGKAAPFTVSFETTSARGILGGGTGSTMGFVFFRPGSRKAGGKPSGGLPLFPAAIALAAIVGLLIALDFIFSSRTRIRRVRLQAALASASFFLLLLGAAEILGGCGSSLRNTNGTPLGATNFLIQGASQNASRGFVVTMVVVAK